MLGNIASVVAAGLVASSLAQTPPSTIPSTRKHLSVSYGSHDLTAGDLLSVADVKTIPKFDLQPASVDQLYTLLLVDLTISASKVEPSMLKPEQLPVAQGINANRTTYLHFWQAGLKFSTDGTLVNTTDPVAYYVSPAPPPGDIPHDYVFYLFEERPGFAPPPPDSPFNVKNVNQGMANRISFSVPRLARSRGVGPLVAANYFQAETKTGSGSSSESGSASASSSPSATSASTTTSAPTSTTSPFSSNAERPASRTPLMLAFIGATVLLFV